MEEKNLTDEQSDLLTEFDEYGFAPSITMPNAEEYAKAWKNSLIDLFERLNFLQAEQKAEIERLKNAYREGLEQGKFDSQQEIERLNATVKIHLIDIDDLHKEREKRVEEVYADFMKDYKIMCEEWNEANERLCEYERNLADGELVSKDWHDEQVLILKAENEELQKQVDKAWWEVGKMCMEERKDTAEEYFAKLKERFLNTAYWMFLRRDFEEITKELTENN